MRGKAGLKPNTEKVKIITSCHITSWQIDGETMETMMDFIFLGSKITADGDCSHEIKRPLFLGRKAMTSLDSILKSRVLCKMALQLVERPETFSKLGTSISKVPRRQWHPTPVLLPGKSHGQRSLVGCNP